MFFETVRAFCFENGRVRALALFFYSLFLFSGQNRLQNFTQKLLSCPGLCNSTGWLGAARACPAQGCVFRKPPQAPHCWQRSCPVLLSCIYCVRGASSSPALPRSVPHPGQPIPRCSAVTIAVPTFPLHNVPSHIHSALPTTPTFSGPDLKP